MLDEGWQFVVIPAFVEELYPSLPKLGQQALNASNNVATETSELETASTIADFAMRMAIEGQALTYDTCVDAARASMPPCEAYIDTIGEYVSHFSGGKCAPLIYFLDHVCKSYGANKKLGQDFFEAITKAVIPSDKTKFPCTRTAVICCNLVSTKIQDGIARFIVPAQVDRLKSKAWHSRVEEAEEALAEQWTLTTLKINSGAIAKPNAFKFFGAYAARTCMYIMGTGKSGFEAK